MSRLRIAALVLLAGVAGYALGAYGHDCGPAWSEGYRAGITRALPMMDWTPSGEPPRSTYAVIEGP